MPPKRMKPEIALEFKDVSIEIKVFQDFSTWLKINSKRTNKDRMLKIMFTRKML